MVASLRWMNQDDYDTVLRLDKDSSLPLSYEHLKSHMMPCNHVGLVLENVYDIYGYVIYILHTDSIEITHLAIGKSYRRLRYGSLILDQLKSKLSTSRRNKISIVVEDRSLTAHLFLKCNEFKCVQVIRSIPYDKYLFEFYHKNNQI